MQTELEIPPRIRPFHNSSQIINYCINHLFQIGNRISDLCDRSQESAGIIFFLFCFLLRNQLSFGEFVSNVGKQIYKRRLFLLTIIKILTEIQIKKKYQRICPLMMTNNSCKTMTSKRLLIPTRLPSHAPFTRNLPRICPHPDVFIFSRIYTGLRKYIYVFL